MTILAKGYIWPDTAGTATALTAAMVASTATFEVERLNRLFCVATLAANADPGLLVRVDVSFDAGVTWINGFKEIAVPGLAVGDNYFVIDLPTEWHGATWRIAARDMQANVGSLVAIYAYAINGAADAIESAVGDQPIELAEARVSGVLAYHDGAGATKAVAAALADEPTDWWVPVGRANEAEIWITTSGGTTSIEIQVNESLDNATSSAFLPAINSGSPADGVVNTMPAQYQFQSAAGTLVAGTYVSPRIPLQPGSWINLHAKRTGAAVNMLGYVRLFRV